MTAMVPTVANYSSCFFLTVIVVVVVVVVVAFCQF